MKKDIIILVLSAIIFFYLINEYFYILQYYFDRYINYTNLSLEPVKNKKNLLLLSNSILSLNTEYMNFAIPCIKKFSLQNNVDKYLYIPYALAKYDNYTIQKTNRIEEFFNNTILPGFKKLNIEIILLDIEEPIYIQQNIISNAKGLYIGGGNTYLLNFCLHKNNLVNTLREKINKGTPTICLSAGTNIISPTIETTNDMPIIEITNLNSLNIIPFQMNLHYNNQKLRFGQGGEYRDKRLCQYLQNNKTLYYKNKKRNNFVIGLPEGLLLHISDNNMEICGLTSRKPYLFEIIDGKFVKKRLQVGERIEYLLKTNN
jgi:dipeptidase E